MDRDKQDNPLTSYIAYFKQLFPEVK